MKRSWLRGMLLGVSLALLLSGGVALAQLTLTVDKECIECWEGSPGPGVDPPASFIAEFVGSGFVEGLPTCARFLANNEEVGRLAECGDAPEGGTGRAYIHASCPEYDNVVFFFADDYQHRPDLTMPLVFGDWTFEAWQEIDAGQQPAPVSVNFRIARVCAVEFVPEPGTIALLGSGLAGLAGYATLRWRSRQ